MVSEIIIYSSNILFHAHSYCAPSRQQRPGLSLNCSRWESHREVRAWGKKFTFLSSCRPCSTASKLLLTSRSSAYCAVIISPTPVTNNSGPFCAAHFPPDDTSSRSIPPLSINGVRVSSLHRSSPPPLQKKRKLSTVQRRRRRRCQMQWARWSLKTPVARSMNRR
ncbi:hypothetical protein DL93DRAFT_1505341 [Clavulina sp. PMI_390]|nr:hypothetical protein DL93DRAFT_829533 [Clavulina sp. PMI_390]KAF8311174.1 hypothetical protein DL93DRAFT_1505341 [Clavulina sp. PMI_390]